MGLQKIIAIILIVIGALGLAYGGITYTSDVHKADIGSLHMSVSETDRFNIPIWAGVAFVFFGVVLLVTRKRI